MRYAVYFTWKDGTEDNFNADSRAERDTDIKEMIARDDFKYIGYCKIYKDGEYGIIVDVLGRRF